MIFGEDSKFYLQSYYGLYHRLEGLRRKMGELQVGDADKIRALLGMVDQLERDLGRGLLLLHATVETLLRNNVISKEQLDATQQQLDALDDEADGQLDPALFRTEEEVRNTPSAKLFLYRLEQEPSESTSDFLKRLEDE